VMRLSYACLVLKTLGGLEYRQFVQYSVVNVKRIIVKPPRLCTGRTAHRGTRGIALLFHDHGTRRG